MMAALRRAATKPASLRPTPSITGTRCAALLCRTTRLSPPTASNYSTGPDSTESLDYNIRLRERVKGTPTIEASSTSDIKTRLAETALSHVPAKGWTIDALAAAAKDLGYPSVLHGLFPGGGADLIDYFLRKSKNEMRAELEGMDLSSMRIPVKIRTACVKRLQLTAPFISKWPDALAVMAQPQNVPMSLRNLGELVDEIWYLAGDRSVDMNWYSKRAMLAGVYTSTEVYMTQDKSPDFQETWKFLDRRLQDVATFGRTTAEVSNVVQFGLRSAVGVLASYGHRTPFDRK